MADTAETLHQLQARHRKENKELQGRITNKKKDATKKTRKGVNHECLRMEWEQKERHEAELRAYTSSQDNQDAVQADPVEDLSKETSTLKINSVTPDDALASDGAKDSPITPALPDSSQPKKRNRQKDRLARRAAEQEAAAVAAEAEAASMTDNRGIEKEYMLSQFEKYGLVEQEIRPDGHCLFSAVADQLTQLGVPLSEGGAANVGEDGKNLPGYKIVRRQAASYMSDHGDDFAGFLEEPLDSYVAKMRDTAEWGGQLELLASANVYDVEIHIVQDRQTEVIKPNEASSAANTEFKKLWLAYYRHGYGLGEHYNSLRKKS